MPLGDGELGSDEGGFALVALLEDFQEVQALLVAEAVGAEVVQYQELDASQFVDEPWEGSVEAAQPFLAAQFGRLVLLGQLAVTEGDLFLFFGWFRRVEKNAGGWRYALSTPIFAQLSFQWN